MGLLATEVRCSTGTHAMARLDSSLESAGAEFLVLGHLLIALKMFKERARTRAEKFCSYFNRGLPQYREAGEIFKRYVDEEITAEELEAAINDHLTPVPPRIRVKSVGGHEDWTTEDGDGRGLDGWKHFVILAWERVPLRRFQVF